MKLVLLFSICLASYWMIRLRNSSTMPVNGCLFVYLTTTTLTIIPGAVLMSHAYNNSRKFQHNMGRKLVLAQPYRHCCIVIKKTLHSLPVLKCTVGNFYHMEGKAKLTLGDNTLHGICFCLITFKY